MSVPLDDWDGWGGWGGDGSASQCDPPVMGHHLISPLTRQAMWGAERGCTPLMMSRRPFLLDHGGNREVTVLCVHPREAYDRWCCRKYTLLCRGAGDTKTCRRTLPLPPGVASLLCPKRCCLPCLLVLLVLLVYAAVNNFSMSATRSLRAKLYRADVYIYICVFFFVLLPWEHKAVSYVREEKKAVRSIRCSENCERV